MKYVDYYAALGLQRNADLAQIKKAYRKLAHDFHPDVSKAPGAEEKFKNAAQAYATLKNPEKRAAFDALGVHADGAEMDPPMQSRASHEAGDGFAGFEGMDFADLFSAMGGRNPFGNGGRNAPRRPQSGDDREHLVHIDLAQALSGGSLNLEMQGEAGTTQLEVRIPAGVRAGQKLRLQGRGGPGRHGGTPGDLYLEIAFRPDARFRVSGADLSFDLLLSPWEAALGSDITVAALDQDLVLTVPPNSSSGKKLRVRGRGLPKSGPAGSRGDLYAQISIHVPAVLTATEKGLFEQLATTSTFTPRVPAAVR